MPQRKADFGNAPINRLRAQGRLPDPPSNGVGASSGALASPTSQVAAGGQSSHITTDPRAPGAPIFRLRAAASRSGGGSTVLANNTLPASSAALSSRGSFHSGGNGWHGHDDFHHDDHSHGSSAVFLSAGFCDPWCWGSSSCLGFGWSSCWGCSDFSVGLCFGDSWCYPHYGYCSPCYYPGYSLYSPGYAYPVYPYAGTSIINYSTGSDFQAPTPEVGAEAAALPAAPAGDMETVYRSSSDHGPMAWSDTAASIVNSTLLAPADQRIAAARQYLGKTPAGAWEVTFEGRQDVEGATELTCRGTTATSTGSQPTVVVRVNHNVGDLKPGQRLSVTGRLTELSVDDASNPGGMLVLENGDVSW
jgi:hypothetical protein